MKRILRKVASIFIATAMVAAMGVSAFAAPIGDDGIKEGNNLGDPVGTSITLYKGITPYNSDNLTIQAPNISYSYSIDPGEANKQITDDQGVSVVTKAGVTGASVDSSDVVWTDSDTMTPGTESTREFTIDFSGVSFSAAGVYRYVITETANPDDPAKAGVTRVANYVATRYLDVYVKEVSGSFLIYGYVCFANQLDHMDDKNAKNVAQAVKTMGFVDASGSGTAYTGDAYYTYNATVGKTLVNDTEHNDNKFPFTVSFANGTITQNIKLKSDVTGTADLTALDSASINGLTSTANIANGGKVKYIGIPCGTTVNVFETNNVSTAAYTSECSGADEAVDSKVISDGEASNTASVKCDKNVAGTSKTVTFTNTLAFISPTGVAMAILPFVILLGFGIGFMVLGTTKRKEEYEV